MEQTGNVGRERWHNVYGPGLLAGLVAALAMAFISLLLRDLWGISPPAEAIGDRIAPLLPVRWFLDLLQLIGSYDRLKQLGIVSVLMGQLIVGALLGLLYAGIVRREQARDSEPRWRIGVSGRGTLVVVVLVVTTLILVALLWPVLDANYRGRPPGIARLLSILGLLFSFLVYGLALELAYRLLTSREPFRQRTAVVEPTRRRALLLGGAGLTLALASGGLLLRLYRRGTFAYDGLQYTGADVQPITPNDRFYVVTKNVVDPAVSMDRWRLEIGGLVERPRSYRFEEIAALPATEQETTLQCISNTVGGGLISNAVWTGIPLCTLIEAAGPKPGVVEVVLHGVDSYTDTFSIEKALEPTTFVAYMINGEPLPERHGYPVRVLVPGLVGEKSVKWVTRIELVDHDAKGFYEQQGWGPNFTLNTHSRFDAPDLEQELPAGMPVLLKGIAFAGDRGVSRVEVSSDGEQSWQEARLDYRRSPIAWVLWSYEWRPTQPGEYKLAVRATDGAGAVQTAEERGTAPEGATGLHRVTARVSA